MSDIDEPDRGKTASANIESLEGIWDTICPISNSSKYYTDHQLNEMSIINMDYVYQFVPREHQGLPIDDYHAQIILKNAAEKAVLMRLSSHNDS